MRHELADMLLSLFNPISRAMVPLLDGLARRQLFKTGATQHEIRLEGMTINYYHQGPRAGMADPHARPPILLVHGIADSALTWALVMGSLARDHDVYALDLPGYGLSGVTARHSFATLDQMREVLAAFVREVIGRPALVAGNSMGGWLAVKLAWSAPELVRAIVLIDAGGAPLEGRASWEPFAETIDLRDLRTTWLAVRQMIGIIPRPLFYLPIPRPLLYLGLRGFQDAFQRRAVREFVAAMVTAMDERELLRPEDLRDLPVPAALVWGRSDHFLPRGSLEFFHTNMPGAPVLLLEHCGHLPQRERPGPLIRFIRTYADRLAEVEIRDWAWRRIISNL